jgi:hypothetical protein
MKFNFEVDTKELGGWIDDDGKWDGQTFESLFGDGLRKSIIENAKAKLAGDTFKKFEQLVSDTIVSDIKLRMQNFLDEEITLTERYGEKTFVGSVEDLIKKRFDEVLLRPVNEGGQTLQGCTSSSKTWIEWAIEKQLKDAKENMVKSAAAKIETSVKKSIAEEIDKITQKAIKEKVSDALANLISK